MNTSSFVGFHFLPPSIHLPPELRPVHGASVAATIEAIVVAGLTASAGVALQDVAAAGQMLPVALQPSW